MIYSNLKNYDGRSLVHFYLSLKGLLLFQKLLAFFCEVFL